MLLANAVASNGLPENPAEIGSLALAGRRQAGASLKPGFVPMFDGSTLNNWLNPYPWGKARVKNGQLHLSSDKLFFLVNRTPHENFILELDAMVPPKGNSGIQFRSLYWPRLVIGYQVDVDNNESRSWAGGLYYQGKGWVSPAKPTARIHPNGWNHYRIEASGSQLRVFVNDRPTVVYNGLRQTTGYIALQDHGGGGVYRFKNIQIMDLPS